MVESKSNINQADLAVQQDQIECLACMEKCEQGYEHWDITGDVPQFNNICKANQVCADCFKKWGSKCPICKVRVCSREHYLVVKFYRMLYERLYPVAGKYIHQREENWLYSSSRILGKFNSKIVLFGLPEKEGYVMEQSNRYIYDAISVLYMHCDIDPGYLPLSTRTTGIYTPLDRRAQMQMKKKGIPHILGTQLLLANMEIIYREVQRSDEPKYIALELIVELMRRGGQNTPDVMPIQLFKMMQDVEEFKKATLKFDPTNEECLKLWSLKSTEQAE